MIANEEEYAAATAAGERMAEIGREWIARYLPPNAPDELRALSYAHGFLTCLMQAMPDGNDVALAKGFGMALGSWAALEGEGESGHLLDALSDGWMDGVRAVAAAFAPRGRA